MNRKFYWRTTLFLEGMFIQYEISRTEARILFKPVDHLYQCIYPEVIFGNIKGQRQLGSQIESALKYQILEDLEKR